MSEEVYLNEPGFEGEAGTVDGEKRNEGDHQEELEHHSQTREECW